MADPNAQTSSEAIIDSLFASISKGENVVSDKTFSSILTEKLNSDSKDLDGKSTMSTKEISMENSPSTSTAVENAKFSTKMIKTGKKESKFGAIKISLKETTKSKILESNAAGTVQKSSTIGEEGEILPSDVEEMDDSKSVNEFDVIDESDGELTASDQEDKSGKKRSKKKKSEKHKKKKSKEKKKKKNDDGHRKSRKKESEALTKRESEKTISQDRSELDRQSERFANHDRHDQFFRREKSIGHDRRERSPISYDRRENYGRREFLMDRDSRAGRSAEPTRRDDFYQTERPRVQDRRPWSQMIRFQLNRNRPDSSYRSRGNYGPISSRQRDWTEAEPSARSGSQSRSFRLDYSNERFVDRRRSHSPESGAKQDTAVAPVPFRASKQWSLAQDRLIRPVRFIHFLF